MKASFVPGRLLCLVFVDVCLKKPLCHCLCSFLPDISLGIKGFLELTGIVAPRHFSLRKGFQSALAAPRFDSGDVPQAVGVLGAFAKALGLLAASTHSVGVEEGCSCSEWFLSSASVRTTSCLVLRPWVPFFVDVWVWEPIKCQLKQPFVPTWLLIPYCFVLHFMIAISSD